jgi:hypothetical protein
MSTLVTTRLSNFNETKSAATSVVSLVVDTVTGAVTSAVRVVVVIDEIVTALVGRNATRWSRCHSFLCFAAVVDDDTLMRTRVSRSFLVQ